MNRRYVCAVFVLGRHRHGRLNGDAPTGQAPNQASLVTQTVAGVQVQHPARLRHRARQPARQGRQLRRHHLRQPRAARRLEGAGFPANPARQEQGRHLRVREGHQRQGPQLSGPVVRRPDALRLVRAGADAASSWRQAPPPQPAERRPRRAERQQPRRRSSACEDTNGDDVLDTLETLAMAGIDPGARTARDPPPSRRRHRPIIVGNNETIADKALDLDVAGPQGQGRAVPARTSPTSARARAKARTARSSTGTRRRRSSVSSPAATATPTTTPTTSPAKRSSSTATWSGTSACRGTARSAPSHQILNGNYGYSNGSGKYPPYYIDSLPPVRDLGRGSPVGVEFYTSYAYPKEFFDNLFEADWSRGRLLYTALTPAGATYHGAHGSRRVRPRRAVQHHRRRSRARRPDVLHDRRPEHDRRPLAPALHRRGAGGAGHGRHPRRRAPAAAALELGLGRDREGEVVDGRAFRRRAREGRAQRRRQRPAMDRARAVYEMQRHGAAPSAALLTRLAKDKNADVRAAASLRRRRPGRSGEGRRRRGAEGRGRRRPPPRGGSAGAHGPVAGQAEPRAGRRHLRAAERSAIASSAGPAASRSSTRRAPSGRIGSSRKPIRSARSKACSPGSAPRNGESFSRCSTSSSACSSRRTSRSTTSCGSIAR